MAEYLERIIDEGLDFYLDTFGAVLIRGPKWCGKTTTAKRHAKSLIKMQDAENSMSYKTAANYNVSLILKGETPRLIDEWQTVPEVWDAIRSSIDDDSTAGRFILTGSRTPSEGSIQHSGAGRFGVLDMYPMTLYESKDSNGSVSLSGLFDGKAISESTSQLTIDGIVSCICRGGWPANLGLDYQKYSIRLRSYLDLIYDSDDIYLKKYAKSPSVVKDIVRSYSRNISSTASMRTIYEDVSKGDITLSESAFFDYISSLKNAYLIDDIPAWSPNLRSKTAIRTTSKRNLVDPSIAALYLGVTPQNYVEDFNTVGLLFESLCMRDLKAYASRIGGKVLYYRDKYGLETDAVITLDDGRYGLIEVKLGNKWIDEGRKNLNKLESLLLEKGHRAPSFKMVLTGTELAYTTDDGVNVVPVGCLGP